METTDWETYGTGKYEKCADCMAHCGYEPTAANAAFANPLKAMWVSLRGIRTSGPMAPEIDLSKQRRRSTSSRSKSRRSSPISGTTKPSLRSRRPRRRLRLPEGHEIAIRSALIGSQQ